MTEEILLNPNEVLTETPKSNYRAGSTLVVTNSQGQVLVGKRKDYEFKNPYQFPQGGINMGEKPRDACFRELKEETGIEKDNIEIVAHAPNWLVYKFPKGLVKIHGKDFEGQTQAWFLLEWLVGDNADLLGLLATASDDEFDELYWKSPCFALANITEFKRDNYREALTYFANNYMANNKSWQEIL